MYEHDHDELNNTEEVDLVGGFLQNVHDLGDIGSDLEAGAKVSAAFSMSEELEDLDHHGFGVFGGNRSAKYSLKDGGEPITMRIAMVRIVRKGSPEIMELS